MPRPFFFKNVADLKTRPYFCCLATESVGKQMSEPRFAAFGVLGPRYNMSNADSLFVDKFFLWGKIGLDAVTACAPNFVQKCQIIGHPRYHDLCFRSTSGDICSEPGAPKVGLITRFSVLNDFASRSPVLSLSKYLSDASTDVYLEESGETIGSFRPQPEIDVYSEAIESKIIFDILRESSGVCDGVEFSLRVHPREREETWRQIVRKCKTLGIKVSLADRSQPFAHWASDLDYLIGTPSTTFYESFLIGVTPISIHKIDSRRQELPLYLCEDKTPIMDHVFCPESLDELFAIIAERKTLEINSSIREILSYECNYPHHNQGLTVLANSVKASLLERDSESNTLAWLFFKLTVALVSLKHRLKAWLGFYDLQSSSFLLTREVREKIDSMAHK
jgi:hypothetical protein